MKDQIIEALGTVSGLQEKMDKYPILVEKLEAFASDMENTISTLEVGRPTFKVKPVTPTTVEDVIAQGNYNNPYHYLKNEVNAKIFRDRPRYLPEEEVILGIVSNGEIIPKGGVEEYWAEKGLELIPHADAYLDQLMRDNTEAQLPVELKGKNIIAYSKEPIFRYKSGLSCYLCVYRIGNFRELTIVNENDDWRGFWIFILRKIIKPF